MKKIVSLLTMAFLAACQHQPLVPSQKAELDHTSYRFNVERIEVVDDYDKAQYVPRTQYRPEVTLADSFHQWADESFSAGGSTNVMEVHITEARITKKDLPKQKSGVEGFFTKEQTEEYEGTLAVELKIYSPGRTLPVAHAEVSAQLSHSLREDATLQDRKAMYRLISSELMAEISKSLGRNIQSYFSKYLL